MGNDLHSIIPQFIVVTSKSIEAKVQDSTTKYCNLDANPQRSDFEIVAHKHEQAQDPNFHF